MMKISERGERLLEFLVIGLAMGISEDLLAVWLSTGEAITWSVFGIVFAVALPFAFLSEFVVDHPNFWKKAIGLRRRKEQFREEQVGNTPTDQSRVELQ